MEQHSGRRAATRRRTRACGPAAPAGNTAACCLVLLLVLCALHPATTRAADGSAGITLWHVLEASTLVEDIAAEFSRTTGVTVEALPFSTEQAKGELLLNARAGTMPDVIMVPSDFLGLHRELGLRSLDESWLAPTTRASAVATTVVDDRHFGVPVISGNFLLLYYNRRHVAVPARNWDDLVAQQRSLDAATRLIVWNYQEMYWFMPFLVAFGGMPVTGAEPTLDTPAMVQALGFYRSLAERGIVDPLCDYPCTVQTFAAGRAAYAINGDWARHQYSEQLGADLGIAPLPAAGDAPLRSLSSTYALAFPEAGPGQVRPPRLKELALHFQAAGTQRFMYRNYGQLPVHETVLGELRAEAGEENRIMLAQLDGSRTMPSNQAMAVAWSAMAHAVRLYLKSQLGAAEAAAQMQSTAVRELGRLREAPP